MDGTSSVATALFSSLITLLMGYIPAILFGAVLGFAICWNPILCQIGKRVLQFPVAVPSVYLLLALILLKQGDRSIVSLIVGLSSVWFIAIYTGVGLQKGIQNSSQWPMAISDIFQGLRFGLTMAWSALVIAEMLLGRGNSIGFYLWDAYNALNIPTIINGIIALTLIIFISDQLLDALGVLIRYAIRSSK